MSNVEYRCLEPMADERTARYEHDGVKVCGSKLFAAPGGTNLVCPQHGRKYTQVEQFNGPLFEYIDDRGKTHHRATGVRGDAVLSDGTVRQDMITQTGQVTNQVNDLTRSTDFASEVDVESRGAEYDPTRPVHPDEAYIVSDRIEDSSGVMTGYEKRPATQPVPDTMEIDQLRDEYRETFGYDPDGRFKETRLRQEINDRRAELDAQQSDREDQHNPNADVDPSTAGTVGAGAYGGDVSGGDDK